jgi:guanine deaminase
MKTDKQLRLQTHLSESLSEIEYTKKLFPAYSTYSEVYDAFGLLTERTILAHCIHLEPSEIKLLVERGCGLSHCPTSNFNLSSGICQVQKLKAAGFDKLSLGTDVSGGYGVGILSTIRDAASAAKVLSFPDSTDPGPAGNRPQQLSIENLFYLATLGGARVCNLDDRVGNFALGKQFDGLLIQTGTAAATRLAHQKLDSTGDSVDRRFSDWILASQAEPYLDGSNPNFFVDDHKKEIDLSDLLEKFLFTVSSPPLCFSLHVILLRKNRPALLSNDYYRLRLLVDLFSGYFA